MPSFIAFSLFISSIHALAFEAPKPTPVWAGFSIEAHGMSPRPTNPPSMAELVKRQALYSNVIMGPDGTCGFVSGSSASAFGLCCDTCSCGFKTSSIGLGDLYCCNAASCASRQATTCIDGFTYSVLSSCDSKCVNDPVTMVCTAGPYTYCNLAQFDPVNVEALFCDSTTVSTTQHILLTYSGESDRTFTPFSGPSGTSTSSSASSSASSTSSHTSSSSSSSLSSSPSTLLQPTSTQPVQSSTTPTSTPKKKSAPIGAIVGGSVGGVAVVAFAALLIVFFMRKSHNSKAAATTKPEATAASPLNSSISPTADPHQPYYGAPGQGDKNLMAHAAVPTSYTTGEGSAYTQQSSPHTSYSQYPPQQMGQMPYDPHASYQTTTTMQSMQPQSPYRPPPMEMAAPVPVELHNTPMHTQSPPQTYTAYQPPRES